MKFALRQYQCGFGNSLESEAVPGTIPKGQNNPRCVRWGLYAEQMTASAFVAPRHQNKKVGIQRSGEEAHADVPIRPGCIGQGPLWRIRDL